MSGDFLGHYAPETQGIEALSDFLAFLIKFPADYYLSCFVLGQDSPDHFFQL
jgi:hypothetical protein